MEARSKLKARGYISRSHAELDSKMQQLVTLKKLAKESQFATGT